MLHLLPPKIYNFTLHYYLCIQIMNNGENELDIVKFWMDIIA